MTKFFTKTAFLQLFFAIISTSIASAQDDSNSQAYNPDKLRDTIFECRMPGFSETDYDNAVGALFKSYENAYGAKIKKGAKGRVGIKVYTNSGPGMCTPVPLTEAVITQLEKRGYKRSDITIVDMSRRKLRECGYLPKLSEIKAGDEDDFDDVNVVDIESGKYFNKQWYYDNPLMPKSVRGGLPAQQLYDPELRKSYLPVPLFLTVDFWINLPVITDMEGLGVCAAIGNASIWNMSNNERFLKQPANASMASAEVSSIPELRDSQLFSIMTLERGQFVGGAIFNSRCSFTENTVLMSSNPVVLDYIAWEIINKYRRAFGFAQIDPMPALLNYCRELKIGDYDLRKINRIFVSF